MRARLLLSGLVVLALVVGAATWLLVRSDDDHDLTGADAPESRTVRAGGEFLEPWYTAVREHRKDPAVAVVVGDSISEGSLVLGDVLTQRYTSLVQADLRAAVGADGGAGFIAPYWADGLSQENVVRTGMPPRETQFGAWGLGGRALAMPGGGQVTYPPQLADRIRVGFGRTDTAGGQGKVFIDGVDVTAQGTVSGAPAGSTLSSVGTSTESGLWWTSPPLAAGQHTVRVDSVAPGFTFVHTGIDVRFGETDGGVRIVDGSQAGASAADFARPLMAKGHWNEVAVLDPDLVLVNLGSNPDRPSMTEPVPDFAAHLRTVVERALEAAPEARVVLVDGYRPGTWTPDAWRSVRAARAKVAAEHPDRVAVFDLAQEWPELAADGSTSQGLMAEVPPIHPNVAGHRRMADVIGNLLAPPRR